VTESLAWHREIVGALESSLLRARLQRLTPQVAEEALLAVEQLKRQLHASNMQFVAVRSLRERQNVEHPRTRLEKAFFRVLALVGMRPELACGEKNGLHELTMTNTTPQLRVLLGLDAKNQRLLAIVGEPLTRSYYGGSVRLAELRWANYCAGEVHLRAP
jgi:hypothetical protein